MAQGLNVLPVFFDFETTNLNANYGRLICGCVKPYGQKVITVRIDETAIGLAEPWNDKEVAVRLRDFLEGEYQLYGFNTVMFDLKFLDSRLLKHRERVLRRPLHKDLMFVAKRALCLSDSRLITVQEFLHLKNEKTRLDPDMWVQAAAGNNEAIQYVVDHCVNDVKVLEEVFEHLVPYIGVIYK